MTEYSTHIEFFQVYPHMHFSKLIMEDEWGNKDAAERYLQKYWLPEQEYINFWKQIQNEIFIEGKSLPDLIYHSGFEIITLRGGCLFIEQDFLQLQKAIQKTGEDYFVIIQHTQDFTEGEPMFRMKYPVNINWKELTSGNYISAVLLEMSYNEYYVFGKSGNWGKYSANDYDYPIDIIGFKPEYASIFKSEFNQSDEDLEEIRKILSFV